MIDMTNMIGPRVCDSLQSGDTSQNGHATFTEPLRVEALPVSLFKIR